MASACGCLGSRAGGRHFPIGACSGKRTVSGFVGLFGKGVAGVKERKKERYSAAADCSVDNASEVVIIVLSAAGWFWGRSSGGERLTHIQEAAGSKPAAPTRKSAC